MDEIKQDSFDKGVKHGTTIRNLDWCSENHKKHGIKMRQLAQDIFKELETHATITDNDEKVVVIGIYTDKPEAPVWYQVLKKKCGG